MGQAMTIPSSYELGLQKLQRILDMPVIESEARVLYCNPCGTVFASITDSLCPTCGAYEGPDVIAIQVENDPWRDYMYTSQDWNAGD